MTGGLAPQITKQMTISFPGYSTANLEEVVQQKKDFAHGFPGLEAGNHLKVSTTKKDSGCIPLVCASEKMSALPSSLSVHVLRLSTVASKTYHSAMERVIERERSGQAKTKWT